MIVQWLNGFWDWVYGIIAQIPILSLVVPDISAMLDFTTFAAVLLPWTEIKAGMVAVLLLEGASLAAIPIRWLITLVRGTQPPD